MMPNMRSANMAKAVRTIGLKLPCTATKMVMNARNPMKMSAVLKTKIRILKKLPIKPVFWDRAFV